MFYGRALFFTSMCRASVLRRSVLCVHCEVQPFGEGDFLAASQFCACVKLCIRKGESESTGAVGLQIWDSPFHQGKEERYPHYELPALLLSK